MPVFSRKIGLKNERFANKVSAANTTRTRAVRRTTSFYVLCFLVVVLVFSGIFEMVVHIKRAKVPRR